MRNSILILIFFFLSGLLVFLGLRYINLVQAEKALEFSLEEIKQNLDLLEEKLTQSEALQLKLQGEKHQLEDELKGADVKIEELTSETKKAQEHIFSLVKQVEGLEKEKSVIQEEKAGLEEKLIQVAEEKDKLQSQLSTIPELGNTLIELQDILNKLKNQEAILSPPPQTQSTALKPTVTLAEEGNSGFLTKDGISTYKPQVKIEVEPAQ